MAQVIPRSLTFDHGSPVYGSNYLQWIGLAPSSQAGETYLGNGALFDGYNQPGNPVAAVWRSPSSLTDTFCFMTRDLMGANVVVSVIDRMLAITAAPTPFDLVEWCVMARITGGTLQGAASKAVTYSDVSCYQGRMIPSDPNVVFQIRKLVAGVPTVLGSLAVPGTTFVHLLQNSIGLTLVVSGTSSPVSLSLFGTLFSPVTGLPIVGLLPLVAASDSSSPLTTTGRCGFGIGTARTWFSGIGTDICEAFEVQDNLGTVLYRDEWLRTLLGSVDSTPADFAGTTGSYLQGRFNRDQFGFSGADGGVLLQRDTVAERVKVNLDTAGGNNKAAAILDHIAPPDTSQMHRSVEIEMQNVAHDTIGAGLCLYLSATDAVTSGTGETEVPMRGYVAQCFHEGTTYEVRLWRYGTTAIVTKIAEFVYTGPDTGAPFPIADTFTLDFEAFPKDDAGGFPTAPVSLKVKIDGSQVVFDLVGAASVTVNSSTGTVTDSASDRVLGGGTTGLYVSAKDPGGDLIYFDAYTEEVLHDPDVEPPGGDSAGTIPVAGEGTATESINEIIEPDWAVGIDHQSEPHTWQFESGTDAKAARFVSMTGTLVARRQYSFNKGTASKEERDALLAFFDARNGLEGAFFYTDPFDEEVKVHFLKPVVESTKRAPGVHQISFTLEELF